MSKLLNLKEWVAVPEAARHLSAALDEVVTEADVLRLALNGQLRLSVYFVNGAKACRGEVVAYEDTKWIEFPVEPFESGETKPLMLSKDIGEGRFLNLSEEVARISGVFDLPMIGAEKLDVEHKYQMLTDGPAVTLMCLAGTFVEGDTGLMYQLQEPLGKNKPYYPIGCLPDDAVLVVKTAALRQFEEKINNNSLLGITRKANNLRGVDADVSATENDVLPWWRKDYDIMLLACIAGDSLTRQRKRTSNRAIGDAIANRIEAEELRGKKRKPPTGEHIKNTVLKGWQYKPN
jgi:hypothetical protein